MDRFISSIDKLSAVIGNFQLGVAVYENKLEYESLKRAEEAFKLRRSKALLESAYKQQLLSNGTIEDISAFESEKPRLYKTEKNMSECRQLATQGMVTFSAVRRITQSQTPPVGTVNNSESERFMRSKLNEYILELSKNTWSANSETYSEFLSAEESMFDQVLHFQEVSEELKKRNDSLPNKSSDDVKMKLSMAQAGLDKINFMRRLIILLIDTKNVELEKQKKIANIALNNCKHLALQDDIFN